MNWKRNVTVGATALISAFIAAAPSWYAELAEAAPAFDLTAPCPPGSISLVRLVGFLHLTPLRPCLLKPKLGGLLGNTTSAASRPQAAAVMPSMPSHAPVSTSPNQSVQPAQQPAPKPALPPRTASHAPATTSANSSTRIPLSKLTATTPMAPAPSTATGANAQPAPKSSADPNAINYCPQWLHDQYVTTGPDGQLYPTWHPLVDPVYGCMFNHEHGADPTTSRANSSLPPFGYVAAQMGMTEAHEGNKVFILNAGDVSDNGQILRADYRIVFHMGTSGVRRYSEAFHAVIYDYVARDGSGREAHIQGLADTGPESLDGSTCDDPRLGGRDFSTIDCDDTYEIWGFEFSIIDPSDPFQDPRHVRTYISGSVAAFDPVLTRNPSNNGEVVYTQTHRGDPFDFGRGNGKQVNPLSADAYYQGCQREAYGGPNYWANSGNPSTYYTDVFGAVQPGPGPGLIQQVTSAVNSGSNELYKVRQDFCQYGEYPPN